MAEWTDGTWESSEGLTLHYRDYPGGDPSRPPILCIPGLTRNARDFEGVADRLAGAWRLICVDLRGRGESDFADDPMTYVPPVYLEDIEALIAALGLTRIVAFGTSLGGLLTMMMAQAAPGRLAGALLNDIGPEIDPAGLARIGSEVGRGHSWLTWLHAARFFAEGQGHIYPDWELEQWLIHAKRLCRLTPQGRIVRDYDLRISEPFRASGGGTAQLPDLWPVFDALAGTPTLVVRGETSDILRSSTFDAMVNWNASIEGVSVPRTGHAPTLDEPEAAAAIDRLLGRILSSVA